MKQTNIRLYLQPLSSPNNTVVLNVFVNTSMFVVFIVCVVVGFFVTQLVCFSSTLLISTKLRYYLSRSKKKHVTPI